MSYIFKSSKEFLKLLAVLASAILLVILVYYTYDLIFPVLAAEVTLSVITSKNSDVNHISADSPQKFRCEPYFCGFSPKVVHGRRQR